jgi:hypothetical protein
VRGIHEQVLNIDVEHHGDHCKFESVFGVGFFVGVLVTRSSLLLSKYLCKCSNASTLLPD